LELHLTPGSQTLPPGKGAGLQADDGWTQCSNLLVAEENPKKPSFIPFFSLSK